MILSRLKFSSCNWGVCRDLGGPWQDPGPHRGVRASPALEKSFHEPGWVLDGPLAPKGEEATGKEQRTPASSTVTFWKPPFSAICKDELWGHLALFSCPTPSHEAPLRLRVIPCGMKDLSSSTSYGTRTHCSGNMEPKPLDCQGRLTELPPHLDSSYSLSTPDLETQSHQGSLLPIFPRSFEDEFWLGLTRSGAFGSVPTSPAPVWIQSQDDDLRVIGRKRSLPEPAELISHSYYRHLPNTHSVPVPEMNQIQSLSWRVQSPMGTNTFNTTPPITTGQHNSVGLSSIQHASDLRSVFQISRARSGKRLTSQTKGWWGTKGACRNTSSRGQRGEESPQPEYLASVLPLWSRSDDLTLCFSFHICKRETVMCVS